MRRRQSIILTYLRLGTEKGFQNVSLSEIASSEGINKASLFSHFSSYEDLKIQTEEYCLDYLDGIAGKINVDFSSNNPSELFTGLFETFINAFSSEEMYCFLNMVSQLKTVSSRCENYSESIGKMITARLTVALDYCVQRSWSNMDNTDGTALLITPAVVQLLIQRPSDSEIELFIKRITNLL